MELIEQVALPVGWEVFGVRQDPDHIQHTGALTSRAGGVWCQTGPHTVHRWPYQQGGRCLVSDRTRTTYSTQVPLPVGREVFGVRQDHIQYTGGLTSRVGDVWCQTGPHTVHRWPYQQGGRCLVSDRTRTTYSTQVALPVGREVFGVRQDPDHIQHTGALTSRAGGVWCQTGPGPRTAHR